MNIYKLIHYFTAIRSKRVKLLGILGFHVLRRRYIGLFLDPVLACNLRCRMCYLSVPDKAKETLGGRMTDEELTYIARELMPHAIKLQIGCATEPTLYKNLPYIVGLARKAGIPYISITTNGQLLTEDSLRQLAEAGLNEVTLSVHGLDRESYETLMTGASFDKFLALIRTLKRVKANYPGLKIRINYVMNSINTLALAELWTVLDGLQIDVLQLRPVQRLGESAWSDFDLTVIKEHYADIIAPIIERCRREGITCICPDADNLEEVAGDDDPYITLIEQLTYYYLRPGGTNKAGFEWLSDTFSGYHRRSRTLTSMLRALIKPAGSHDSRHSTKKLNYKVK